MNRVARIVADRLAIFTDQNDLRLQVAAFGRRAPIDHDLLGHTSCIVGLVTDRNTRNQVDEFRGTGFLGDDRQSVGIPFEQLVATGNFGAVFDEQLGAVTQLVAGTLFAVSSLITSFMLRPMTRLSPAALFRTSCGFSNAILPSWLASWNDC